LPNQKHTDARRIGGKGAHHERHRWNDWWRASILGFLVFKKAIFELFEHRSLIG
jgi:hypothetical protein